MDRIDLVRRLLREIGQAGKEVPPSIKERTHRQADKLGVSHYSETVKTPPAREEREETYMSNLDKEKLEAERRRQNEQVIQSYRLKRKGDGHGILQQGKKETGSKKIRIVGLFADILYVDFRSRKKDTGEG